MGNRIHNSGAQNNNLYYAIVLYVLKSDAV